MKLDPQNAEANLRLGMVLVALHKPDLGKRYLQRAVDLDPAGDTGAKARLLLDEPGAERRRSSAAGSAGRRVPDIFPLHDDRRPERRRSRPRPAPRGGFFAKVRRGLFMTHTEILEKLGTAVKKGLGFDESVLESLEEALLAADVGAETAAALADAVRERAGGSERKDLAALRRILLEEIERLLASAPRSAPRGPTFRSS